MRLIDADELKKAFCDSCSFPFETNIPCNEQMHEICKAMQQIDKAPTVADVVHCGECKYARQPNRKDTYENYACEGVLVCTNCSDSVKPYEGGYKFVNSDWYCADGEVEK